MNTERRAEETSSCENYLSYTHQLHVLDVKLMREKILYLIVLYMLRHNERLAIRTRQQPISRSVLHEPLSPGVESQFWAEAVCALRHIES